MYSYKNKNNELISISEDELISIANNNNNLISLSIKLNTTVETARIILEELKKINANNSYKLEQYNRWTEEEDQQLEKEYRTNMSIKQISEIHGRTMGAIKSRLKYKNLYIADTEITNITIKEEAKMSGMFRIRFNGDNRDEVYFYNIEEKNDNIDPTRPLFEELFKTEVGETNDKYDFIMLDKSQFIPEIEETIKEEKNFNENNIYNLEIFSLTKYIPKWCNRNDENSLIILDLKNRYEYAINYYYNLTFKWLKDNNLLDENIILAVVPSHISSEKNISGIASIASKIIETSSIKNGIDLVTRKITINKKATSMYRTTLKQDIESLKINKYIDITNKTIVLLDDVTTYGDSFRAAAYHLYENGAKKVIPLAMGKTVIPNE